MVQTRKLSVQLTDGLQIVFNLIVSILSPDVVQTRSLFPSRHNKKSLGFRYLNACHTLENGECCYVAITNGIQEIIV
jgi:hypothetical protein